MSAASRRMRRFSHAAQKQALERQHNMCACCGEPIAALGEKGREAHRFGEAAHAHHVVHVKHGGTNAAENCVILCDSCHYCVHEGGNYRFGTMDGSAADYPHYSG